MRRWISWLMALCLILGAVGAPSLAEAIVQYENDAAPEEVALPVEDSLDDGPEAMVEEANGPLLEALEADAPLLSDAGAETPAEVEAQPGPADLNDAYQRATLQYEHSEYKVTQGFYWRAGPSASEATKGYVSAGETIVSDTVVENKTTGEMWLKKDGEEKYVLAGYRRSGSSWILDTARPQYLEFSCSAAAVTWSNDAFPSGITLDQCTTYTLQGTLMANATISRVQGNIYSKATGVSGTTGLAPLTGIEKTYAVAGSGLAQSTRFAGMEPGDYRLNIYVYCACNRMQDTERLCISRDFTITEKRDTTPPTIGKVTVTELTSYYYSVACPVSDDVGVIWVECCAWTKNNGQDDLCWHECMLIDGVAKCTIPTSEHNGETGCVYVTQLYIYDAAGNSASVTQEVSVPKRIVLPTSVKLNKKKATLLAGQRLTLKAKVSPSNADTAIKWTTSDKKVATVTSKGVVKAVGGGKATITVSVADGKYANCEITVPTAPEKLKLNKSKATLQVGKKLTLKASLTPSNAKTKLTWSSSNKKVATVTSKGVVKAAGGGKATITVKTTNGKKATCKVTVLADKKVKYRALLIGQEAFDPVCKRNSGDVALMAKMLASVKGPEGGSYAVTKRYNLTCYGVLQAIQSTFGSADDNDVSLFFIATHGNSSSGGRYAGALATPSGEALLIEDLAEALSAVRGRVIVILESCGSGAAIYGNGSMEQQIEALQRAAEDFDDAAIQAFSAIDPGVLVDAEDRAVSWDAIYSNTGELRVKNKFYVLTASRYLENSWGSEKYRYNFFTKWLTEGIGTSGRMPADTSKDGTTTLKELYKYISKVGDKFRIRGSDGTYYQHVQVYPSNSGFKLFKR